MAAAKGVKFIVSPASKSYLDMKYDKATVLGLNWAGEIEVRTAYEWDPVSVLSSHPPEAILGVEAQCGPRRSPRWKTSSTWLFQAAGGRGNRLVTGRVATVGGLQPAPCRSRTAMVGARNQFLSLGAGAVAVGK